MFFLKRFFLFLFFTNIAAASPWFTGPLLAPAGKTIPAGHFNFEPYGFFTVYPGQFKNIEAVPIVTAGITDFLDLQMGIPIDMSWDRGQSAHGIGDYSVGFGVQVLKQKEHSWWPDLRVVVQEVFPTGKFDNLSPNKLGVDQTGLGAYQTFLAFNFQKLVEFSNQHYLRSRLSIVGATASKVTVNGVNVFGGNTMTHGSIKPGDSISVDLAFEYTLTQHWVPVFEALLVNSKGSDFQGNPGFTPGGTIDSLGGGNSRQVSLAPAIEYNFNSNIGIIYGVWFSVTGPHAAQFVSNAIALNCYF